MCLGTFPCRARSFTTFFLFARVRICRRLCSRIGKQFPIREQRISQCDILRRFPVAIKKRFSGGAMSSLQKPLFMYDLSDVSIPKSHSFVKVADFISGRWHRCADKTLLNYSFASSKSANRNFLVCGVFKRITAPISVKINSGSIYAPL